MDPRSLPVSKASTKRPSHFSTTPSHAIPKKNRVGGIQTEKLKAAAEIKDKQKSRKKREITFDIHNNHSRRYIVQSLEFSTGICNIVVTEALGYQQSQYQTCQKNENIWICIRSTWSSDSARWDLMHLM